MFLDQLGHSGAGGLDADETLFSAAVRKLLSSREPGPPSPLIGIQAMGKSAGPADPTALSVLTGVLHVRVGWSMPPDQDYLQTEVWRAANSTAFVDATLQTSIHGTVYYDEGANVSTNTYSYWIIHFTGFRRRKS